MGVLIMRLFMFGCFFCALQVVSLFVVVDSPDNVQLHKSLFDVGLCGACVSSPVCPQVKAGFCLHDCLALWH